MAGNRAQRSPMVLPYGFQLHGQYRIEDVLGQGGFGITYCATDLVNNRRVAVKELFPSGKVQRARDRVTVYPIPEHQISFEKIKASFSKETMMLVQLQDIKDVVRLYHAFLDNGTSYYVMEYLEGETLSHHLQNAGPMSWNELSHLMKPIISTLSRLHKAGVIHRDVSPDNIFMLTSGEQKLIDFGNVRSYGQDDVLTAYVKGNFAPWEQFSSTLQQGPYTDVYSLCVTIYYSLSGKLPPKATERFQTDHFISLQQLCPGVPGRVCRGVEHGMAVSIQDRTPDMEMLYWELFGENISGQSTSNKILHCQIGQFEGMSWSLPAEQYFTIGRSNENDLVYPANARGVSRVQVKLFTSRDGRVFACDKCSTYGTMCITQTGHSQLQHGIWYDVSGCVLFFGAQEQYWIG